MPFTWLTDTYRDHIWKLIELGANDGGGTPAMTYVTLDSSGVTLAPEVLNITTQGTTQKYETSYVDKLDITITNNVMAEALKQLYVHTGVPVSPETERDFFDGDFSTFPLVAVRITTTANRISDGALRYIRYIFPKCNVKSGDDVTGFAVAPASLSGTVVLSAQKTAADLLGVAITLPAGVTGAYYYRTVGPS